MMSGWKELVLDIIKLTDTVQRLNDRTEKLADQTNDIDKRVVRLETLVEVAQAGQSKQDPFRQIE
jgi:predicted  nucleic acid-binding Zn-ribbon protein